MSGYNEQLHAQVIVNPPQDITHFVQIQPIRTRKTNGLAATVMGTAAQEGHIKSLINRIWAQAGVRIDWLPVSDNLSDFAFDGSPADYSGTVRPSADLHRILDNAPVPPKSGMARVINLFFVEVVPAFTRRSENTVNGFARLDRNGIAAQVGANLLTSIPGRTAVAAVLSHEIGHNLGLPHEADGLDNLMSPGRTAHRLTPAQKAAVFTNGEGPDGFDFLQSLIPGSRFAVWAGTRGLRGDASADADFDGVSNGMEFMFDSDPLTFTTVPQPVFEKGGLTWTLPKRWEALEDGFTYKVESSADLLIWVAAGIDSRSGCAVVQDDEAALVVRLEPGGNHRFMRINAVIPDNL